MWALMYMLIRRTESEDCGFHDKMCKCNCPEGLTCMLVFAIFAAVLGMFQFGYNTGVINAPQKIIEDFIVDVYKKRTGIRISDDFLVLLWSITVSVFNIGGMVGGIIGGTIANKFGRKGGLLLNDIMGILGAMLMGLSKVSYSVELLVFGRLVIGFNCGLNTALVPMYLSEISPVTLRGGLGTVNQLGVTIGLLLSQVLGVQAILGTEKGWPILLGIAVVPAVLQLLLLPFCPESPRYLLISRQEEVLAREALQRLRCSSQVEEDIEEMKAEDRAQEPEALTTMWQLVRNKSLQLPLLIGIMMQLSQQLSGINAVLYYSTKLFKDAGLSESVATYATIGVGANMVIMTLISIPLMDRAGRRTLHLYGLGGMFIFSIFITISLLVKFLYHWMTFLSVVSTLCFVIFFAIGPGSIPWMITAELFSQGPRPSAMSIAVLVNWFASFIVSLTFPQMQKVFENYTFLPFTCLLAVFWTFTYKKVPETKNKTFEEISALFRRDDIVNINGIPIPRKSLQSRDLIFEDKPVESCKSNGDNALCHCAHEVIILPELTSLSKWHQVDSMEIGLHPDQILHRQQAAEEDESSGAEKISTGSAASSHVSQFEGSGSSSGSASDDETSTSDVQQKKKTPAMQRRPGYLHHHHHCHYGEFHSRKKLVEITPNHIEDQL